MGYVRVCVGSDFAAVKQFSHFEAVLPLSKMINQTSYSVLLANPPGYELIAGKYNKIRPSNLSGIILQQFHQPNADNWVGFWL